MWRIYAHSIGTKASSVHLSFVASRWGHPTGRVWLFSHSIEAKSLDIWSIFLQDGVTLFGSESHVLISSEGITTVGLLGAFFRPVLGVGFLSSFGCLVGSEAGRVLHSVVFASGEDSVCIPLAYEGVGLGPSSSSGPVASRPPLADRSASARPLLHLVTLRGFPSAANFSLPVAAQAGFARWPSPGPTCRLQLATWSGCRAKGHSISRPSMA